MILVRAAALSNFVEVAREFHLPPYALLRDQALSERALMDPEGRISAQQVANLLEAAAEKSGCRAFGVRMIEARSTASFGILSLLMAHQTSLRSVLQIMMQYHHMLNEAAITMVEENADLFIIRQEFRTGDPTPTAQACEMALAMLVRIARANLGPRWRPLEVRIVGPRGPELSIYRRFFGCVPTFDSDSYSLVCRTTDIDQPNLQADPALAAYAKQILDMHPLAQHVSTAHDVRTALYQALHSGKVSLPWVASRIGETPRTLQRRLAEERTSFSDLTDEVRRTLVLRYLRNRRLSLLEISEMLGYAQPSGFARWFSSHFGMAASSYRRTLSLEVQERG